MEAFIALGTLVGLEAINTVFLMIISLAAIVFCVQFWRATLGVLAGAFFVIVLLIAGAPEADAGESDQWYTFADGQDTPFESRYAVVEPDWDRSSAATMLAAAGINGQDGNLNLYIIHPRPTLEALTSEFTGKRDNCEHDNWRLAIDKREYRIAESYLSTDNTATFLEPEDMSNFWQAFLDGVWLAIQVDRNCAGDVTTITLVYSLRGSRAAAEHVLGQ